MTVGPSPTIGGLPAKRPVVEIVLDKIRGVGNAIRTFRNWPQVLFRCALSYATARGPEFVARTRTGLVLSSPADPLSRWPIFEVLAYDAYHLDRIEGLDAADEAVVLDIGAHVGAFSIGFASRFPNARVTCFEPAPLALSFLHRNVELNGLEGRVRVIEEAVGAVERVATLYGAGASCENSLQSAAGAPGPQVRVTTLAAALQRVGGFADLVKLDCEGSEYEIVLDGRSDLGRSVGQILLEYHAIPGRSWTELRNHLEHQGFTSRWHEPHRSGYGMAYFVGVIRGSRRGG